MLTVDGIKRLFLGVANGSQTRNNAHIVHRLCVPLATEDVGARHTVICVLLSLYQLRIRIITETTVGYH